MHSLKRNSTINWKRVHAVARSPVRLWQRGFWDHVIRNERDHDRHLDYIHFNPVKHRYVQRPEDYVDTSYLESVRRGWYEIGWGHQEPPDVQRMDFE